MSENHLLRFQQHLKEAGKDHRPCPLVILDDRNEDAASLMWLGLHERLSAFIGPYYRDVLGIQPRARRAESLKRALKVIQSEAGAKALGLKREEPGKTPQVQKTPLKPIKVPRRPPPRPRRSR